MAEYDLLLNGPTGMLLTLKSRELSCSQWMSAFPRSVESNRAWRDDTIVVSIDRMPFFHWRKQNITANCSQILERDPVSQRGAAVSQLCPYTHSCSKRVNFPPLFYTHPLTGSPRMYRSATYWSRFSPGMVSRVVPSALTSFLSLGQRSPAFGLIHLFVMFSVLVNLMMPWVGCDVHHFLQRQTNEPPLVFRAIIYLSAISVPCSDSATPSCENFANCFFTNKSK